MQSDFPDKFGIPRQSGLIASLQARIVFEAEFRDINAVRGLESYSHIWLIWEFSEAKRDTWSATVRPPRLGGNVHVGVFATRSPFRPNPIGLSCVALERIEQHPELGPVLHVSGADLMDGTPIFDIKPYLPYADCQQGALSPYERQKDELLEVVLDEAQLEIVPVNKQKALVDVLAHDPRPAYIDDPERVFGLSFAGFNIQFMTDGKTLRVIDITKLPDDLS